MATELTVREPRELSLPDSATLEQELKAVRAFQATVKKLLVEGHDFGVIPGTQKPTLLKPGAEKIDKILHLADTYEVLNQVEDWQKGFFHYEFKCRLIVIGTDVVVSEGMGSCNSMESKYRYRWVFESGLPRDVDKETLPTKKVRVRGNWTSTYRIENDDPYTLANTILKMAKKRAHIDATLSAGRLSDVFTQDIEDMPHIADEVNVVTDAELPKSQIEKPKAQSETLPDDTKSKSSGVKEEANGNLPDELDQHTDKDETPITPEQLAQLTELMKSAGMTLAQLGKYMNVDKKWNVRKLGDLQAWQFEELTEAFKKGMS